MNIAWNFKSRGTEETELSSEETYNFQIWRKSLFISDQKFAKIFKFAMLDIKL